MKLSRFFGLYFIFGCIFLFEPTVQLFDVLPNAFGFLLIAHALKEIHVLEYRIESAMKLLYYGAGVSLARFVLMFFNFDMDSSAVLSAVSILGVAEVICLICFFIYFFAGLSYLAQRSDSENVLDRIDAVKTLCIVFAVIHTAATILPELFALPELTLDHSPEELPGLTFGRLKLYKNYTVVICSLVSFIAGVWWLKETVSFINGVRRDELFRRSVEKRYGEYVGDTPREEFYISLKSFLVLFTFGCLLALDLRIYQDVGESNILVLPAWVGTVFFATGVWVLGKQKQLSLICLGLAAVQAVFSYLPIEVGALVPLVTGGAVFLTENFFKQQVEQGMDVDISTEIFRQRIAMVVYIVLSVAYAITDMSLIHSFKVVAYLAWIALVVWNCSAVRDEIKSRRILH